MSIALKLTPLPSVSKTHLRFSPLIPKQRVFPSSSSPESWNFAGIRCAHEQSDHLPATVAKPRWEEALSAAASLYPVYVTVGGVVACVKPSTFSWFVERAPVSYSLALGFIMLAMGVTLELKDLFGLFRQRPLSILFGCVAQYTIMPVLGLLISKLLGLTPSLSVGLILLGCCPGGTASNVVHSSSSRWLPRTSTACSIDRGGNAEFIVGRGFGDCPFLVIVGGVTGGDVRRDNECDGKQLGFLLEEDGSFPFRFFFGKIKSDETMK